MFSKVFRIISVISVGIFVFARMYINNAVLNDIMLSALILVYIIMLGFGAFFSKEQSDQEKKSFKKYLLVITAIGVIWLIVLSIRYLFIF